VAIPSICSIKCVRRGQGSTAHDIGIAKGEPADPNLAGLKEMTGLGWVDFEVSPHSPDDISYEANAEYAKGTDRKLYAIGDGAAVNVSDASIEVVGEGEWKVFN
jgi:hypothetical protein